MVAGRAAITVDRDVNAVRVVFTTDDDGDGLMVTLSPVGAVDLALKIARAASELEEVVDEQ